MPALHDDHGDEDDDDHGDEDDDGHDDEDSNDDHGDEDGNDDSSIKENATKWLRHEA